MKKFLVTIGMVLSMAGLTKAFEMHSSSFKDGESLPVESGWKSGNKVPDLSWSNAPQGTKSFALICDDPDAPTPTPWVHWVVFNIPASQKSLTASLARTEKAANNTIQGKNSYDQIGWDGPHPPGAEKHRYYFKLYALDTLLTLPPGSMKESLVKAMEDHILGTAQLMGTYQRAS